MLGTFVQSIVTFTDAIFVSRLGEISIGAFGNGSIMYMALFMFCRGLADGTQITVARRDGEGKAAIIGETLFNAQVFQLILSTTFYAILFLFGEFIILSVSKSPEYAEDMLTFISIRGLGLFFAAQYVTLVGFFIGLGRTKIILFSALLIALCNIFLDYCLVFGNLGFPAMGLAGAPTASSISEMVGFLFLLTFLIRNKSFDKYAYRSLMARLNLKKYFELIKLSFPLMLQGVLSLTTWLIFFMLIEHMGTEALETAHNIRYMYFLAFVPIFGFGATTKTIVSNLVGQNKLKEIPAAQRRIALLSLLSTLFIFHGSVLYPELLIKLVDHNPNIAPQVLADSTYILRFVSGSIFIFSVVVVIFNSVAGLGKTVISLSVEVLAIGLYLIGCYFFIIRWKMDIKYIWWVEYIYFIALGIFSYVYFIYYRKKYILNEQ